MHEKRKLIKYFCESSHPNEFYLFTDEKFTNPLRIPWILLTVSFETSSPVETRQHAFKDSLLLTTNHASDKQKHCEQAFFQFETLREFNLKSILIFYSNKSIFFKQAVVFSQEISSVVKNNSSFTVEI